MGFLKLFIFRSILWILSLHNRRFKKHCTSCGYIGYFLYFGIPRAVLRPDAQCPRCFSVERHRLLLLYLNNKGGLESIHEPVLHFAPERFLEKKFRSHFKNYKTADLYYKDVDLNLNIENLDLVSSSYETIICSHVLEHVDDQKALLELRRVLKKGGKLFVMVPVVEGWDKTYENTQITDSKLRILHFGQSDHVRYYGRDLRDRIRAAGFEKIEEFTAEGEDVVKYGLMRGEKVFICS